MLGEFDSLPAFIDVKLNKEDVMIFTPFGKLQQTELRQIIREGRLEDAAQYIIDGQLSMQIVRDILDLDDVWKEIDSIVVRKLLV